MMTLLSDCVSEYFECYVNLVSKLGKLTKLPYYQCVRFASVTSSTVTCFKHRLVRLNFVL